MDAGRVLGQVVADAGRGVAGSYRAIDPDVRRHLHQLPLVGLSMLMLRRRAVVPLPADGAKPVIFVHGLGGRPGNFVAIKAYFATRRRTRCYAIAFNDSESIEALAAQLTAFVHAVVTCNELPDEARVDIVAHSMGGIVVRLALEDPVFAARVATVVTLGSPHSGTYLARLASTRLTLDLRPNSTVMCRLADGLPRKGGIEVPRLVALWSDADTVILPAEGAQLDGARNIHMDGFSHYSYLIRPHGWRTVYRALENVPDFQ